MMNFTFVTFSVLVVLVYAIPIAYADDFQHSRPISEGPRWIGKGSYLDINEKVRDDTDYIESQKLWKNQQDSGNFKLSSLFNPRDPDNHIVRFAYSKAGFGTNSPHLTMTLKQGEHTIEEWTYYNIPSSFKGTEHQISIENARKISDYSNLYISVEAWCDNDACPDKNSTEAIRISWIEFIVELLPDHPDDPIPKVIGTGVYQIETEEVVQPYSENLMKFNEKGFFYSYLPYSKITDETDILNYGKIEEYEKFGTFYFLTDENTFVTTTTGVINRPIQLQVQIHDNFASETVQHVGVYGILSGEFPKKIDPLFEISLDKGQPVKVHDENDIIKDVFTTWSLEGGYLWANIDIVFEKILPVSDLEIETWDQNRIPSKAKFSEILQVKASRGIEHTKKINLTAEVIISHDSSSPVCKINFQCFTPFNARVLETGIVTWKNNDEVVHSVVSGASVPNNKFSYYIAPGGIAQHRFDISGTYNYYCDLHPWATGQVSVYENIQDTTAGPVRDTSSLLVYSVTSSGSLMVENNDIVIKPNRDLWFEITGNVDKDLAKKRVTIVITTPDGSQNKLYSVINEKGFYRLPVVLNEKWLSGEYEVVSKSGDLEIGKVEFKVQATK